MRTLFAGRRGDQCIIFRDQGSTDPPGGLSFVEDLKIAFLQSNLFWQVSCAKSKTMACTEISAWTNGRKAFLDCSIVFSRGAKRENSRKTEIHNCNCSSPLNNQTPSFWWFKRFLNVGSNNYPMVNLCERPLTYQF